MRKFPVVKILILAAMLASCNFGAAPVAQQQPVCPEKKGSLELKDITNGYCNYGLPQNGAPAAAIDLGASQPAPAAAQNGSLEVVGEPNTPDYTLSLPNAPADQTISGLTVEGLINLMVSPDDQQFLTMPKKIANVGVLITTAKLSRDADGHPCCGEVIRFNIPAIVGLEVNYWGGFEEAVGTGIQTVKKIDGSSGHEMWVVVVVSEDAQAYIPGTDGVSVYPGGRNYSVAMAAPVAQAPAATATATLTATPAPSNTPTAEPSATLTVTVAPPAATATPTAEPSATPAPTATATVTPAATTVVTATETVTVTAVVSATVTPAPLGDPTLDDLKLWTGVTGWTQIDGGQWELRLDSPVKICFSQEFPGGYYLKYGKEVSTGVWKEAYVTEDSDGERCTEITVDHITLVPGLPAQ